MGSDIQTLSNNLSVASITIQAKFGGHPSRSVIFTSIAVIGLSTPWLIANYRKFLDLGDYFITNKPLGYLLAMALKPFGGVTLSTSLYNRDQDMRI